MAPAGSAIGSTPPGGAPIAEVQPKERILVVEDDPAIADLLRIFLETEGYEAQVALDGEQAIERLSHEPFDLVTLDLALPKVDGREVLHSIRSNPSTKELPVIVVTAYPYLLEGGEATAVMTKPPDVTQLLMLVRRELARSSHGQR